MTFLVGEGGIGEDGDEGPVDAEGAVTYAQEGGEEAGDDEDGQQDDEGCCERWRGHADVTLKQNRYFRFGLVNSINTLKFRVDLGGVFILKCVLIGFTTPNPGLIYCCIVQRYILVKVHWTYLFRDFIDESKISGSELDCKGNTGFNENSSN